MKPIRIGEIAVQDSAGNLHTIEVMRDLRPVHLHSGKTEFGQVIWYQCNGIEFTQDGAGYRNDQTLLIPIHPE